MSTTLDSHLSSHQEYGETNTRQCLPKHGDIIYDICGAATARFFDIPSNAPHYIESGPAIEWLTEPLQKPALTNPDTIPYALEHNQAIIKDTNNTTIHPVENNPSLQRLLTQNSTEYLKNNYNTITYTDYDTLTPLISTTIDPTTLTTDSVLQYQLNYLNTTLESLLTHGITKNSAVSLPQPLQAAYRAVATDAACDPFKISVSSGSRNVSTYSISSWSGTGALEKLNGFLVRPEINYAHKLQYSGFKRALIAESQGDVIGVAAIGHPNARKLNHRKDLIVLHRLATHEKAPKGLESHLISRTYRWAYLSGYDVYRTHAGVADNTGTIYQAANLTKTRSETVESNQRSNRANRDSHSAYTKNTYNGFMSLHPFDGRRPHALRNAFSPHATDQYLMQHGFPKSPSDYFLTHDYPLHHDENSITEFLDTPTEQITNDVVAVFTARGIDPSVYNTVNMDTDINPLRKRTPLTRASVTDAYPAATIVITDPTGDRRNPSSTAVMHTIKLHDEIPYPDNVLRWLFSLANEWAAYTGYQTMKIPKTATRSRHWNTIQKMKHTTTKDSTITVNPAIYTGACSVNLQTHTEKALSTDTTQESLTSF